MNIECPLPDLVVGELKHWRLWSVQFVCAGRFFKNSFLLLSLIGIIFIIDRFVYDSFRRDSNTWGILPSNWIVESEEFIINRRQVNVHIVCVSTTRETPFSTRYYSIQFRVDRYLLFKVIRTSRPQTAKRESWPAFKGERKEKGGTRTGAKSISKILSGLIQISALCKAA